MPRTLSRALARGLVSVVLLTAACTSIRRNAGDNPATIVFRNDAPDQATVYVVAAAEFRRIGTVSPARTERLKVTSDLTYGTVNIVARLLSQNEMPQTGPVRLQAGAVYEVRLTIDGKMLTFLQGR
jgi:hypothetical protein